MRLTFNLMVAWTHKTVGFCVWRILEWFMKSHYMHKSHCLVRILGWWSDWAVLFRKWGRKCSNSEWRTLSQHDNRVLWPQLNGVDMEDMWFQQNGATCHTARNNWVVARKISWLCHPTQWWSELATEVMWFDTVQPLSLGFVKSHVYANKPQTIPELKAEIRCVIGEIEPHLCGNVIENFVKRARVCQQSCGGHLSDIVFHS